VGELTVVEICAGAGGQALGLEQAGFSHSAAIEFTDCRTCTCFLTWGFASRTCVGRGSSPPSAYASASVPTYEQPIMRYELVHHQESAIPCLS
jgi:DNA (cytosine-5)-methyltransferase 1